MYTYLARYMHTNTANSLNRTLVTYCHLSPSPSSSLLGISIYDMQFRNPTNPSYGRGFYAWLALLIVQILSLDFFRRRHFEFFYHTHFTFVVCYVMAYLHEPDQGRHHMQ